MKTNLNYQKRVDCICDMMKAEGIDVFIGTRGNSITYLGGVYAPWRSAVVVDKEGFVGLHTCFLDSERVKDECWLDNVTGCVPLPGLDMWEVVVDWIKSHGYENATIGIELGQSARVMSGFLWATELQYLQDNLPQVKIVNSVSLVDRASYVKDSEEIKLLRQAAAMADAAQERVKESLYIGIRETEIAGIAEMELRRLGTEFHWPVTGSNEIASGYRTCYPLGGCTPASEKIVQRGENLLVDVHPTYQNYCSDLSHNYIFGKPSSAQQKLADAYLQTCETLISNLKAGTTIREVAQKVNQVLDENGYRPFTLPAYGHAIGVIGHEWYPTILDNDEFRDIVLEENVVEIAAIVMNVPEVGGMRLECPVRVTASGGEELCKTPLELTILDL
ncbi:MAG: aminopeptidase P family protein [Desulfobacter sp.]|nr:MAG: aminopeptidase P family protein [Desulfobacter sp.]